MKSCTGATPEEKEAERLPFLWAKVVILVAGYKFKAIKGVGKGAAVSVDITDVLKTLGKVAGQSERAMKATIQDVKSRAPGWINKAVREDYTIQTAEIKKSLKVSKNGTFNLAGIMVDNVTFTYKGRMLTPIHFNMRPKTKPARKRYSITAEIKRGNRRRLIGKPQYERPAFLASTSGAGSTQIPWQREGKARLPIVPIKTLSVPQMIASQSQVKPNVGKAITEGVAKRAAHQIERFLLK